MSLDCAHFHKTSCCDINPRVVVVAALGRRSVVMWTLGAKLDVGDADYQKLIVLPRSLKIDWVDLGIDIDIDTYKLDFMSNLLILRLYTNRTVSR